MEYYTVVADTYENAVRKAKSQYGDDIRIHSRRDYMTHGGIFTRRQPRCEIVCYSSGKVQKKDTKVQDKDMKEEATNMERLSSDIHYIKKSLSSVDEKIDALSKQYSDLLTRVSALETKMKIYHNREDI